MRNFEDSKLGFHQAMDNIKDKFAKILHYRLITRKIRTNSMQPGQKSHSLEEGGGRQTPKENFPGKQDYLKRKCKAVDPDKAQETAPNHGRAGPSTTTDLEDVVVIHGREDDSGV
ncbi:uncharacterized protein [Magallana gigas]|uniref:uncharacterized protein n=1 Tax=Magallana gigas TaxID=29159 RepID=UPI00333E378A